LNIGTTFKASYILASVQAMTVVMLPLANLTHASRVQ